MPLGTLTGEKEIIAKLKLDVPNVHIQRGAYLDDGFTPKADAGGLFQPYMLVQFGGSYEYARDNGLSGPRWDTQRATFTIYIVAPYDEVAQEVKDRVRNSLVGYRPHDGSALTINTGYSFVDADLGFNRFVQVVGFSYLFNLS